MRTFSVCTILFFCCLVIGCGHHLVKVPTGAMQPTIPIGATALIDESAYSSGQSVNRFDLVIHAAPIDDEMRKVGVKEDTKFIFRIVGLSGEKVEIKNGDVFINDKLLEEPFGKNKSNDNFKAIIVPKDEFFLLGDNRPESNDSRYWKPSMIKRKDIFGKVVKIF